MTDPLPLIVDLIVTDRDIRDGRPNAPFSCPLALAAIRCCKVSRDEVSVGDRSIYIGSHEYRFTIPALHFVAQFDRGRSVEPGTYQVVRI